MAPFQSPRKRPRGGISGRLRRKKARVIPTVAERVEGFRVEGVALDERGQGGAGALWITARRGKPTADECTFARRECSPQARRRHGVRALQVRSARALGIGGRPGRPVHRDRQFIVRKRERRIELECRVQVTPRIHQLEPVERRKSGEIFSIGVGARGSRGANGCVARRRYGEDGARERPKGGQQRIRITHWLLHRAKLRAVSHLEDVGDEACGSADLDEITHHESPRACLASERHTVAEGHRLRRARCGERSQQVGDALAVHDIDVGPSPEVEREQVDACVAQPLELGRARHVRERDDDPLMLVQRRRRAAHDASDRTTGRWRPIGTLPSRAGGREECQDDKDRGRAGEGVVAALTHTRTYESTDKSAMRRSRRHFRERHP